MSCDSLVVLYLNVLPPSKIKWTFRVQNFSHIKRSRRPGASTDAHVGSWRTHFRIFLFVSSWKRPKSCWKFLYWSLMIFCFFYCVEFVHSHTFVEKV